VLPTLFYFFVQNNVLGTKAFSVDYITTAGFNKRMYRVTAFIIVSASTTPFVIILQLQQLLVVGVGHQVVRGSTDVY
jgi:hypothetical protein